MSERNHDDRRAGHEEETVIDERGRAADPGTEDNEARIDAGGETDVDGPGDEPGRGAIRGWNPDQRGKWVSGLVALIGAVLIVEPFVLGEFLLGNVWNYVLVGVLLAGLGAYNYNLRSNEEAASTGAAGLVVLLGLWVAVSPLVYGAVPPAEMTSEPGFWLDVVLGVLVFGLGFYSAYETRNVKTRTATTVNR